MLRPLLFGAALLVVAGPVSPARAEAPKAGKAAGLAPYVHVVIFRMKKDAPADAVEQVIADCHRMLAKIDSVRAVRAGRPADRGTPKVAKRNYDVALLVLVDDYSGLQAYLESPLHLKFVEKYDKYFDMQKLEVFDFMDQKK